MAINERLLLIRKTVQLNQEVFGKRIGVTRSAICNYENGSRPISEQIILAVCREFGVNGEWLRTGDGEMMAAAPSSVLDALAREYGLRQKDYVLIEKLVQMSPAERDGIFRFMQDVVDGARGCAADPDAPVFPSGAPLTQDEVSAFGDRAKALAEAELVSEERPGVSALSARGSGVG
jgi:transcriptional regulator with XRE-family HTH domain